MSLKSPNARPGARGGSSPFGRGGGTRGFSGAPGTPRPRGGWAPPPAARVSFASEGMHLVFLGDLGHPLTEAELAPLRGAEVLLAAAGGPPTIDFPAIPALVDAIGPRLILPMHYKTPRINLNIQPVERFLDVLPG